MGHLGKPHPPPTAGPLAWLRCRPGSLVKFQEQRDKFPAPQVGRSLLSSHSLCPWLPPGTATYGGQGEVGRGTWKALSPACTEEPL